MRKKYRFVLMILFGLLGLLVVGIYFSLGRSAPRDPLEIAYEKIEEGMGCAEAMAIVGPEVPVDTDPFDETPRMFFYNNQFKLEIRLRDGRVTEKKLESNHESLSDRLRRWLGL